MYEKILLPTDGSVCSEKAAKHALSSAQSYDSRIIVLNVLEIEPTSGIIMDTILKEGKTSLNRTSNVFKNIEKEDNSKKEIEKIFLMKEGTAANEILKTAKKENVDLIIIGASGKHALERFLLGSVTQKVVKDAKCPVLTVH
ncbi:MAG: universal stress protein [Methanobacteriaceae archaeon]|nr:universal stress protein [Methanobacteriaceae archaeon]